MTPDRDALCCAPSHYQELRRWLWKQIPRSARAAVEHALLVAYAAGERAGAEREREACAVIAEQQPLDEHIDAVVAEAHARGISAERERVLRELDEFRRGYGVWSSLREVIEHLRRRLTSTAPAQEQAEPLTTDGEGGSDGR